MIKDYEKIRGKTIEFIFDQSDSDHEKIKFQFTDGSSFVIQGNASGMDVWYDGMYYRFYEAENDSKST